MTGEGNAQHKQNTKESYIELRVANEVATVASTQKKEKINIDRRVVKKAKHKTNQHFKSRHAQKTGEKKSQEQNGPCQKRQPRHKRIQMLQSGGPPKIRVDTKGYKENNDFRRHNAMVAKMQQKKKQRPDPDIQGIDFVK